MPKKVHATTQLAASLAAVGALALAIMAGCSKTNEIDAGPGAGPGSCNGEACDGSCVEGVCRGYCDQNYQCPDDGVCTDVANAAVCLPPGARVYEPYEPFDMLAKCATSGCEVPLDAPPFEGVLRSCDQSYTPADMTDPDFDFESACASPADYGYLLVAGRRIYDVYESNCNWSHAGAGPPDTLIRFSCDDVLDYQTYEKSFKVSADFWRVVEHQGSTYVWRSDADPFGSVDWRPSLYKLTDESQSPPASCDFGAYSKSAVSPEDCELPAYPATGGAIGADFEGFWLACDSQDLRACEQGWDAPGLNDSRMAMYIDSRGFGQYWSSQVSAAETRPTECNAAFRRTAAMPPNVFGVIVGRSEPIGYVSVAPHQLQEVVDVPAGLMTDDGMEVPAGKYIVRPNGQRYFKQVPLPDDFIDPCEGTEPNLTW
jgi:hypothetical protein